MQTSDADLFADCTATLRLFLTSRAEIVERIEALVSAQRKAARESPDFERCFGQYPLKHRLEEAHWAAGFRPRRVEHVYNDLIDPAEIMARGVHCWRQTWWPGRGGRVHFSHTLFNLYVLRWLQFLSMRVFDDGAEERLAEIQGLLDELWRSSPGDQPAFVRDARWLIPLAQSLITDELAPYFEVARLVNEALPEGDALEIQKAQVRMLGGHLTSQIRHYCTRDGVALDEHSVVLRTRNSNALDIALLIQGLVPLLRAYERSRDVELAGAICQGISPDPELFLNRVDLLGAYSMIEDVLVDTPQGERHVRLVKEYGELIGQLREALREDAPRFRPVAGGCSPYGVLYGLPSNLIEHMALKAVEREAERRFSLEDVFRDGDAAKLDWVNGWRKLPHIDREVQRLYDYPQRFAEEVHERVERALRGHEVRSGQLYVESRDASIPELAAVYFVCSDTPPYDRERLLAARKEGHFLVSYETQGRWIALKKDLLTEVLGEGRDARVNGLPQDAARVLQVMCGRLAS